MSILLNNKKPLFTHFYACFFTAISVKSQELFPRCKNAVNPKYSNRAHWAAGSFRSDWNVEQQPIYFWDPYPLRNCPKKKLKSSLGKIWVFLKIFFNFWIFLKKIINQKYCSKNHRWYLRLWKKFEKHLLNKFFKNRKLGSSDQDQNFVSCQASY